MISGSSKARLGYMCPVDGLRQPRPPPRGNCPGRRPQAPACFKYPNIYIYIWYVHTYIIYHHFCLGRRALSENTYLSRGSSNTFYFHPENWGRISPILTCAHFSDGLVKNHQPDIPPDLILWWGRELSMVLPARFVFPWCAKGTGDRWGGNGGERNV